MMLARIKEMKQKKRCKRRILFILTLALFFVEIRKDFIQKEQQKMAQMQNIFVDVSIKICIAQERRFFNFLGNTVSRFFAVEQPVSVVSWSVRSQSSRQRPMSKGKAFLKHAHPPCFCPDPDHPCNLQQLRCESDENGW